MHELIKKIRNKPSTVKNKIILFISLALTFVIVLLWIYSLPYRFSGSANKMSKDLEPFNVLKENISNTVQGIK